MQVDHFPAQSENGRSVNDMPEIFVNMWENFKFCKHLAVTKVLVLEYFPHTAVILKHSSSYLDVLCLSILALSGGISHFIFAPCLVTDGNRWDN